MLRFKIACIKIREISQIDISLEWEKMLPLIFSCWTNRVSGGDDTTIGSEASRNIRKSTAPAVCFARVVSLAGHILFTAVCSLISRGESEADAQIGGKWVNRSSGSCPYHGEIGNASAFFYRSFSPSGESSSSFFDRVITRRNCRSVIDNRSRQQPVLIRISMPYRYVIAHADSLIVYHWEKSNRSIPMADRPLKLLGTSLHGRFMRECCDSSALVSLSRVPISK